MISVVYMGEKSGDAYRTRGYFVAKYSRRHLGTEIGTSDINLVTGIDKITSTSLIRGAFKE